MSKQKYKEAESLLTDYLSGALQSRVEKRKLELKYPPKRSSLSDLRKEEPDPKINTIERVNKLEKDVLKYVDDGTYVYLKNYTLLIEKFLKFVENTNEIDHKIIIMFYQENYLWKEIADEVNLSESQCRRRRRRAIQELCSWL